MVGVTSPQKAINSVELTKRIQAGSRTAEEEFVENYSRFIRLFLLKKTQNPDIAKDCCQQTLLITLLKIRAGDIIEGDTLIALAKLHFVSNVYHPPAISRVPVADVVLPGFHFASNQHMIVAHHCRRGPPAPSSFVEEFRLRVALA